MSEVRKRLLVRLSFCPCGYPVLDESIALGTVYEIYPDSLVGGFFYRCGKCGAEYRDLRVVMASQILHPERPPAPLPWVLFCDEPATAQPTAEPSTEVQLNPKESPDGF